MKKGLVVFLVIMAIILVLGIGIFAFYNISISPVKKSNG